MKNIIFSFILLGFASFLNAQTVDSIKVEQAGDLIKIHYKILNSTQYQTFRVTISARINGGLESKLVSLIGDVGENVQGGKSDYIVIWDVLKDVEEVTSVDFSVRAELLKDDTPKAEKKRNVKGRGIYVLAVGELPKIGYGGRVAITGSWGISMSWVLGKVGPSSELINLEVPEWVWSIDLTKRIVNKKDFRMHLYAGVDNSTYPEYYSDVEGRYWKDHFTGIDGGIICNYKMLAFSLGLGTLQNSEISAYVGLGVKF
jgi:hypothetical protein